MIWRVGARHGRGWLGAVGRRLMFRMSSDPGHRRVRITAVLVLCYAHAHT